MNQQYNYSAEQQLRDKEAQDRAAHYAYAENANSAISVRDTGMIVKNYSDLKNSLAVLEENVRMLGSKMNDVLRPSPPKADGHTGEPMPTCAPLALSIYEDNKKVQEIQTLIRDLYERLEL